MPYLLGIICALNFGIFPNVSFFCFASFVFFIGSFLFQTYYKPVVYFKKALYIISINVFLFVLAFEACYLFNAKNDRDHYTHNLEHRKQAFIGVVDDLPVATDKATKVSLKMTSIQSQGKWHYATGNVLVYLKDLKAEQILPGNALLFHAKFSYLTDPKNPNEFNYKTYLNDRNIFHTVFADAKQVRFITHQEDGFSINSFGIHIKSKLVSVLRNSGLSQEAFSICAALLMGYDDEIDNEIMQSFSHSGTLHILSVSGMHTGVLYAILIFIFSKLDKFDRHRKWKCAFVILSLLMFVAVTGFSPSVLRAVLMLSLVMLGKTFYKQGNSYNTLLLSAFLLLLYNPNLIHDIGFLLSYFAVFGIMYFYPVLSQLYVFENKILQWLWASVLISVAATLLTLPVSLYYFHQFPIWFALSNLVIIPISMFIMMATVLILVFYKLLLVNQIIVAIVNAATSIMLWFASLTDQPGMGFIDSISFSRFDLICGTVALILFLFIIAQKRYNQVMLLGFVCIFWLAGSVFYRYQELHQKEFVAFHVNRKSVFVLREGKTVYGNFSQLSDKEFQRYVKPYLLGFSDITLVPVTQGVLKNAAHTIALVGKAGVDVSEIHPDYILVSNDTDIQITTNGKTKPLIIADCSNSYNFVRRLKKRCQMLDLPFYWIKEKGALQVKI
ncbi:MAG: ComEC/Rec2 family competence protein [Bacteroidota bacterium]